MIADHIPVESIPVLEGVFINYTSHRDSVFAETTTHSKVES